MKGPGVSYRVPFFRPLPVPVASRPSLLCWLVGLTFLWAGGCMRESSIPITAPSTDTTTTDALGRTVAFAHPPSRVLTLAPNLTEIVFAVGAADRLVGASPSDNYPPSVQALPRFSTFPLDRERVVALAPDLVLATDQVNGTADADALLGFDIPTYFFSFLTLDDIPRAMTTAAGLLGTRADSAVHAFEEQIERVKRSVAGAARPRVLLLIGDEVPYAFGRDSYASEMVRAAGGGNLTDAFDGQAALPNDEFVLTQAPEVIIVLVGERYDPARLVEYHPAWASLPAVRNGRVFGVDADLVSRPGPRVASGLERIAALLHPDRFTAQ